MVVAFAKGGGTKSSGKAGGGGIVSTVVNAISGAAGGCGTGTVNGKKGFQPGNRCAQGANRNPAVAAARKTHTEARRAAGKHVKAAHKAGTSLSKEGRAAVRAAATAHRELRNARETAAAGKREARNASRREARAAAKSETAAAKTTTTAKAPETKAADVKAQARATLDAARTKAHAEAHAHAASNDHELVAARILEKARSLGSAGDRVRLADLHAAMPDVPKPVFDKAALHLADKGAVSLFRLDNPREIGARDRAATVRTPSGEERHIGYFGGRSSGGDPAEPGRLAAKLAEHRAATPKVAKAPAKAKATPADRLPLKDFADRVVKAAHASPTGGFGAEKTFISHAKAQLEKSDPAFRGMSDEAFKAKLVEAHRAGHLELGRADLVEAMSRRDLEASSTPYLKADYHFIRHPEKVAERVAASARESGDIRTRMAARHLADLKAGRVEGDTRKHVDRLARGATKDELFAAAREAGIDTGPIKTKKALVEHLKALRGGGANS